MNELYEIKEMLMKELEEYGQKEMSAGSLEIIDKLTHAIKNLCKIIEASEEEYSMDGGSYDGYMDGGNSYRRGGSSRAGGGIGQSRARGRGSNARRDSRGRYSSNGNSMYGGGNSRYGGGSRYAGGSSYDDGMEDMIESIKDMMGELPQEVQRDAQKFVKKLEEQIM